MSQVLNELPIDAEIDEIGKVLIEQGVTQQVAQDYIAKLQTELYAVHSQLVEQHYRIKNLEIANGHVSNAEPIAVSSGCIIM